MSSEHSWTFVFIKLYCLFLYKKKSHPSHTSLYNCLPNIPLYKCLPTHNFLYTGQPNHKTVYKSLFGTRRAHGRCSSRHRRSEPAFSERRGCLPNTCSGSSKYKTLYKFYLAERSFYYLALLNNRFHPRIRCHLHLFYYFRTACP